MAETEMPGAHRVIERPHLRDALDDAGALTILRAPTGFGKSMLVRQWLQNRSDEAELQVSLRVRRGEGDEDSFWLSLADALADAGVPFPNLPRRRSAQSLALRMLTTVPRPVLLWIDNFENVEAPSADQTLIDLVRDGNHIRLLVCLRGYRSFSDALISGTPSTVLGASDLRFTSDETDALLRLLGLSLPPQDVAIIQAESGGWVEPIRAVAALLAGQEGHADISAVVDVIADRWLRVLLPQQDHTSRIDFGLTIALPEWVTPALAEALTGDGTAEARLRRLVDEGFLFSETRAGEATYSWTPAARRVLVAELERRHPDRLPGLHGRLSRWYAEHDEPAKALDWAIRSGDTRTVVHTIDRHWRRLLVHGAAELNRGLLQLPRALTDQLPAFSPTRAIRSLLTRIDDRALSADLLPADPIQLAEIGKEPMAARTLNSGLAVLLALRMPHRLDEAREFGERLVQVADAAWRSHPGDVAEIYPSVQFYAGEVHLSLSRYREAIPHLESAYRRAKNSSIEFLGSDAAAKLAFAHALTGDLPEAEIWLRRHDGTTAPEMWLAPYIRSAAGVARLLIAVDRLDLDAASTVVFTLMGNVLPDVRWVQELYARSLLALSAGVATSVLERLDDLAKELDGRPAPPSSAPLLAAIEADLLLSIGQGNRVRSILQGPYGTDPLLQVVRARLALLSGDAAEALRVSSDVGWERNTSHRLRHEMLLIRVVAAYREHDPSALDLLSRAVTGSVMSGSIRPFTTVPRADLAELAEQLPAAAELLADARLVHAREIYPTSIELVSLTPREQEVLERLVLGQSIRQISISLHVTYSTVRTQQRSLYRKLGVATQPDAVTRARQVGLLRAE